MNELAEFNIDELEQILSWIKQEIVHTKVGIRRAINGWGVDKLEKKLEFLYRFRKKIEAELDGER